MTKRIESMLQDVLNKRHHKYRQSIETEVFARFTDELSKSGLPDTIRSAKRLEWMLSLEKPVILANERIVLTRTVCGVPEIFNAFEWEEIKKTHYIHERGKVCNISPNYAATIGEGLLARRDEAMRMYNVFVNSCVANDSTKSDDSNLTVKPANVANAANDANVANDANDANAANAADAANAANSEARQFLGAVISSIDAVLAFVDRYSNEAERAGNADIADMLRRVPKYGAETFHEALQFFRILHFCLWAGFNYHNTIGRFDQYMYPYLKNDLDSGRINYEEALELLEEFFLTFNRDSDLYIGMQQGDNGQSMVLGGIDESGRDTYNVLSEMCLKASLELKLIDPKINLRVSGDTDLNRYELATTLTKQGLGFPQYSNDDAVIPGLVKRGYSLEDARNYVVAACWEFIIPGVGMDVPNIGAISYSGIVDKVVRRSLKECGDFDSLMDEVKKEFQREVDRETERFVNLYIEPSPFMSVLMDGCIESGRDVSRGLKYNNYGLHGTGIANAADSLAAVKMFVYDKGAVSSDELINALDADFDGYDDLRAQLRLEAPKMGEDDDYVDDIANCLVKVFAEAVADKKNDRNGCYRAGTGSAMYYVWHANELGATPDGRKKHEYISANYAPSLSVRTKGPISVIRSFSKADLSGIMNGGPLTIEMHDTVFQGDDSIKKVALLVKSFIDRGGHQLQVNKINKDTLLDAQKNPEKYANLIVRVWGWSGYFVELDRVYQNQIIQRVELKI